MTSAACRSDNKRPALESPAERVVSSTYRGILPAPRAASAASAGRAGGRCFFFISPPPQLEREGEKDKSQNMTGVFLGREFGYLHVGCVNTCMCSPNEKNSNCSAIIDIGLKKDPPVGARHHASHQGGNTARTRSTPWRQMGQAARPPLHSRQTER